MFCILCFAFYGLHFQIGKVNSVKPAFFTNNKLISRNFLKVYEVQCGKPWNSLPSHFPVKSISCKILQWEVHLTEFSRKNENFTLTETHCGNYLGKFTLTEKILFRQITYLVFSLVKLLLSRNFCQKCMREFP